MQCNTHPFGKKTTAGVTLQTDEKLGVKQDEKKTYVDDGQVKSPHLPPDEIAELHTCALAATQLGYTKRT